MNGEKFFFGNWKMNLQSDEAVQLLGELTEAEWPSDLKVAVFPSLLSLTPVACANGDRRIAVGAQDCFWEDRGAYTGEVSPKELAALKVKYVLIGHSERRRFVNETSETVNKKVKAVLRNGMTPVLCIGETLEDRKTGRWPVVLERELKEGLEGVEVVGRTKIIIAYEPIWAIGTGNACSVEEATVAHGLINNYVIDLYGEERERMNFSVIYGGSVDAKNIKSYFDRPEIDGALVGGASQKKPTLHAALKALGE